MNMTIFENQIWTDLGSIFEIPHETFPHRLLRKVLGKVYFLISVYMTLKSKMGGIIPF